MYDVTKTHTQVFVEDGAAVAPYVWDYRQQVEDFTVVGLKIGRHEVSFFMKSDAEQLTGFSQLLKNAAMRIDAIVDERRAIAEDEWRDRYDDRVIELGFRPMYLGTFEDREHVYVWLDDTLYASWELANEHPADDEVELLNWFDLDRNGIVLQPMIDI